MDYIASSSPLTQLLTSSRRLVLPKGQVIHNPEHQDLLNFIQSGFIKRYSIDKDGTESIQVIYGPKDIFPLTPVFKQLYNLDLYHGPETFHYEAITDAVLYSIDQSTLKKHLDNDPGLYKDLLFVCGQRLNSNIHRLENLSLKTTHRRIAHLLVYFAHVFSEQTDDGLILRIPLTHQIIADSLSIARETVSRRLARLEEKGLIRIKRNIIILDLSGLEKEAY